MPAERALRQANIPKRFFNVGLSDFKLPNLSEIDSVVEYKENIEEHIRTDGVGLLLLGPGGTGKTMLSCIIANTAISKGFSCYYTTVSGYIRLAIQAMNLKDAWMADNSDTDSKSEWATKTKLLKDIRNSIELLVLDDVGKEHTTGTRFAEDEIDFLLRYRFDLGLPTVMSSNYPVSQWATMYSESMESFIHEAYILVSMTAKDYRREGSPST